MSIVKSNRKMIRKINHDYQEHDKGKDMPKVVDMEEEDRQRPEEEDRQQPDEEDMAVVDRQMNMTDREMKPDMP